MTIRYATMRSPVGPVAVAWKKSGPDDVIVAIQMQEATTRGSFETKYADVTPLARLKQCIAQRFGAVTLERDDTGRPAAALARYFEGDVRAIDAVKADPGGTEFQARVWRALRRIAPGATRTYGEIAEAAGRPGAARAAGGAVGSNPIPIVIPCHRVVGSNRSLTGFGGGLPRKRWLLEHEGAIE
ncbi:MAG TPA: methylated-DNA--[protein]-cysteine S-methyltransferase, partial [bacterium]|nr:methylated-DNA--[protein]-cysteine S-methyltransferase [bacterium]